MPAPSSSRRSTPPRAAPAAVALTRRSKAACSPARLGLAGVQVKHVRKVRSLQECRGAQTRTLCTEGGKRGRQEVTRQFREAELGGRLVYSLTGSSPIAPEVLAFLRDALQAPMYEAYGSTEAGYVRSWGLTKIFPALSCRESSCQFTNAGHTASCSPQASL